MLKLASRETVTPPAVAVQPLAVGLADCAKLLGVSESSVRRLTSRGEINSFKIAGATRWSVAALREYVDRQAAAAASQRQGPALVESSA